MDIAIKALLPVGIKIIKMILPKIKEAIDKAPELPSNTTRELSIIQIPANRFQFIIMVNEVNILDLSINKTVFKKVIDINNNNIDEFITELTSKL